MRDIQLQIPKNAGDGGKVAYITTVWEGDPPDGIVWQGPGDELIGLELYEVWNHEYSAEIKEIICLR